MSCLRFRHRGRFTGEPATQLMVAGFRANSFRNCEMKRGWSARAGLLAATHAVGNLDLKRQWTAARPRLFCADCEMDHIHKFVPGAFCDSPDGVSRFQCPGLARSSGVILRRRPCFLWRHHSGLDPVAYLKRSILRRGFDFCSNSQSIQTKAMPKLTTTPRNSHVSPGVVSVRASKNECEFSERKPCSI